MKANTVSGITHLLPAGKSHSFSIMHEIDNSVNNYCCAFVCRIVRFSFYYLIHLHSFDGAKERSKKMICTQKAGQNFRLLIEILNGILRGLSHVIFL